MSKELEKAQARVATFDLSARAQDDERIPVVISSDAVVEVSDGPEILVHSPDAVDLARAPLPLIATHSGGQINVGIVEDIGIRNGQMLGYARFGKRPEASGYREDVLNRIIRSVSVGYARIKGGVRNDGVLVTTRWMPVHVAMVAEPADVRAGFFREFSGMQFSADECIPANQSAHAIEPDPITQPVQVISTNPPPAQPATTSKGAIMAEANNAPAGGTADIQVTDNGTAEQRMAPADIEVRRKQAIANLCSANNLDSRFAQRWIADGASLETVADDMLKIMAERGKSASAPALLDMSRKEVASYSVLRALRAAQSKDWSKAGLELEAHKAVMARAGVQPRNGASFFVPMDVQARGRRDMTVAGVSGSNYLVSTDNQPGSFIDLLRNDSAVLALGATRLTGLVGNITIPRMTAGGTAYWLGDENTAITESQATIGQVSLSPKNVAALTEISHQLMQQSDPSVESMVMNDLAAVLGLAVDVACIRGSGLSGQPHGIVGTSGVGSFDTDGTDTFSDVVSAQTDVMAANALKPGCAYLADPASAALLMGRSRFASTDTPIWNGNLLEGTMAGFPCKATNQMSANTMLFGWWPSIIVAEFGVLELAVNPYSDFTRGLSQIRAWYSMDTAMRYPGAFSYDATVA